MSHKKKPYRDKREIALQESERLRKDIENLENALILHTRFQSESDSSIRGMIRREIGGSHWHHGGEGKLTTYRSSRDLIEPGSNTVRENDKRAKVSRRHSYKSEAKESDRYGSAKEKRSLVSVTEGRVSNRKNDKQNRKTQSATSRREQKGQMEDEKEPNLEITCIKAEWDNAEQIQGQGDEDGHTHFRGRSSPPRKQSPDFQHEKNHTRKISPDMRHEKKLTRTASALESNRDEHLVKLDSAVVSEIDDLKAKVLAKASRKVIDRKKFSSTSSHESKSQSHGRETVYSHNSSTDDLIASLSSQRERPKFKTDAVEPMHQIKDVLGHKWEQRKKQATQGVVGSGFKDSEPKISVPHTQYKYSGKKKDGYDLSGKDSTSNEKHKEQESFSSNSAITSRWAQNVQGVPPSHIEDKSSLRRNSFSCATKEAHAVSLDKPQRQSTPSKINSWHTDASKPSQQGWKGQKEHVANRTNKDLFQGFSPVSTSAYNVVVTLPSHIQEADEDNMTSRSKDQTSTLDNKSSLATHLPLDDVLKLGSSSTHPASQISATQPFSLYTSTPFNAADFHSKGTSVHPSTSYSDSLLTSGVTGSPHYSQAYSNGYLVTSQKCVTALSTVSEEHPLTALSDVPPVQHSTNVDVTQLSSVRQKCDADVESWLHNLCLQSVDRYIQLFADHQMDMASVRLLTATDLRDMGIHALGPIMKIMKGVQVLSRDERPSDRELLSERYHEMGNGHDLTETLLRNSQSAFDKDWTENNVLKNSFEASEKKIHNLEVRNETQSDKKSPSPRSIKTPDDAKNKESKSSSHRNTEGGKKSQRGTPSPLVARWKQTSDDADYRNITGRSPVTNGNAPDVFIVKEMQEQKKKTKSVSERRPVSAKTKGKNVKVTGKPPASSKAADDGVSVAAMKFSMKQQQQKLKEQAEERSSARQKQMRDEMAAKHVQRRSSSLDRGTYRGHRSGLERSSSFSSMRDALDKSPRDSVRSEGVESVLSTKRLSVKKKGEGDRKPIERASVKTRSGDAVTEMESIIDALEAASSNEVSPVRQAGRDGRGQTLGTIRELQKQLSHLEQHLAQQEENNIGKENDEEATASHKNISNIRESLKVSHSDDEESSPRLSARGRRSARERRRRERAALGWSVEDREGLVLSQSFSGPDKSDKITRKPMHNSELSQSKDSFDYDDLSTKVPHSDLFGKSLSLTGAENTLNVDDDKEALSLIISGTSSTFTSTTRENSGTAIARVVDDTRNGTHSAEQLGSTDIKTKHRKEQDRRPIRSFKTDSGQTYSMDNMKKIELKREHIYFSEKDLIGDGAFSQVFKGTYQGSEVAVKRLKAPLHSRDKNYFVAEVSLLQELRHPHVVMLLGVCCVSESLPLMVLEYLAGGNLHSLLHNKNRGALENKEFYNIGHDVSAGMLYLHHHQPPVLHLDLKSRNVLIGHGTRAKVADFGFSKLKHEADVKVSRASKSYIGQQGTPAWMAPELLTAGEITAKADIYSFGIVLWEMWTRQTPYEGCSVFQVLENVRVSRRPVIPGDCPRDLSQLIQKCWDQNPAARPGFKEVLRSLEELSESEEWKACDQVNTVQKDVTSSKHLSKKSLSGTFKERKQNPKTVQGKLKRLNSLQLNLESLSSKEEDDKEDKDEDSDESDSENDTDDRESDTSEESEEESCRESVRDSVNTPQGLLTASETTSESHNKNVHGKNTNMKDVLKTSSPSPRHTTTVTSEVEDSKERKSTAQELIDKYLPSARSRPPVSKSYDPQQKVSPKEKLLPLRHSLDKPKPPPLPQDENFVSKDVKTEQGDNHTKTPEAGQGHTAVKQIPAGVNDGKGKGPTKSNSRLLKHQMSGVSRKSSSDLQHLKVSSRPPYSDGQPYTPSFHEELHPVKPKVAKTKPTSSVADSGNLKNIRQSTSVLSYKKTEPYSTSSFMKSLDEAHKEPGLSFHKPKAGRLAPVHTALVEENHGGNVVLDNEVDNSVNQNVATPRKTIEKLHLVLPTATPESKTVCVDTSLSDDPSNESTHTFSHTNVRSGSPLSSEINEATLEILNSESLKENMYQATEEYEQSVYGVATDKPASLSSSGHFHSHNTPQNLAATSQSRELEIGSSLPASVPSQESKWNILPTYDNTQINYNAQTVLGNLAKFENADCEGKGEAQGTANGYKGNEDSFVQGNQKLENGHTSSLDNVLGRSCDEGGFDQAVKNEYRDSLDSDSEASTILDISEDSLSENEVEEDVTVLQSSTPETTNSNATKDRSKFKHVHESTMRHHHQDAVSELPTLSASTQQHSVPSYNKNRESFFLFEDPETPQPFLVTDSLSPKDINTQHMHSLSQDSKTKDQKVLFSTTESAVSHKKPDVSATAHDMHQVTKSEFPDIPIAAVSNAKHGPAKSLMTAVHEELHHRTRPVPRVENTESKPKVEDSGLEKMKRFPQPSHDVHEPSHSQRRFPATSSNNTGNAPVGPIPITRSLLARGKNSLKPVEPSPPINKPRPPTDAQGNNRFSIEAGMLMTQKQLLKAVVTRETPTLIGAVKETEDENTPTVVSLLKKAMTDRRFAMGDNHESQDTTPDASWSLQEEEQ